MPTGSSNLEGTLLRNVRAFALPHYQEPHRAYHNDGHVQHMLNALAERQVLSPVLALAVWGHDLIYDPHRHDNEERSTQVFNDWLALQGAPAELRAEVQALILATKHTSPPSNRAEGLLLDADLSILGADEEAFAAYDTAIRQEYQHVPGLLYRPARRKVLQAFLNRQQIYTTPEFADLEEQARRNLRGALR